MTFKPGESGNPEGRPTGSRNRFTELREALADDLDGLLETTKQAAHGGDMTAMRLLLERTIPAHKPASAPVSLPELENAESLTEQANAIMTAVSRAQLAPDTAAQLLASIGNVAKAAEIDELESRLAALEETKR